MRKEGLSKKNNSKRGGTTIRDPHRGPSRGEKTQVESGKKLC